jgi:2'-5' RNA ligase
MRLFIAIAPPKPFVAEAARLQRALQAQCTSARFVPSNNFHITLRFLGEGFDAQALYGLTTAMAEAVRGIRPFALHLGGFGRFHADKPSQTVFLNITGPKAAIQELNALEQGLGAALEAKGFGEASSHFRPHITLARAAVFAPVAFEALKDESSGATMQVQQIILFESVRKPGGMLYIPLHRQSLG